MSKQLKKAGQQLLKMGYYKNHHARSGEYGQGHEEAVADVLENCDFTRLDRTSVPSLSRGVLKEWWQTGFGDGLAEILSEQPQGSFILQPGGSQSFPDLLIRDFGGRWVALECKSSKGSTPMWNDSVPKQGAVYVFSSERHDSTTLFMGQQVITVKELDIINSYHQQFLELKAKCSSDLEKADTFGRGWVYSHRPQFFQQGGAEFANYFEHSDRSHCEQQTMEYLAE